MSDTKTLQRVIDSLATTTRYPKDLFTPTADLENQLGIDSVKRVELLINLGEEFGLDLKSEQNDASIRTVEDVANWISMLLGDEAPAPEPVAEAEEPPRHRPEVHREENSHANRLSDRRSVPRPHIPMSQPRAQSATMGRPLEGRTAFITGSGRGVGRTIARVLADRGAKVIVNSFHSRNQGEETVAEINAGGGSAVHIWGSVAEPEHVDRMFDQIAEQYGLDILVCNASDGRIGAFMDLTSADWDRAFRTNVSGHHQCAVRAAEIMRPRGGGAIVTMSAVGAHGFIDGLGAQGIVKAAVESMTRYLACELGSSGIRVNCVAGGPVYGELLSKFPDARAAQNYWEARVPDSELCSPIDLAESVAFLVSDQARGINGTVLMTDHGFSATADGQLQRRAAAVYV